MMRVLLAEDHPMVRAGLRAVIEDHPGWEVCAEAIDGQEALGLCLRQIPDIAIVDVSLPVMNGIALTQVLQRQCPQVRVLLYTMHDDDETVAVALAAGVRGYVLKSDSSSVLEAAISAIHAGKVYFSPTVSELMLFAALNGRKRSRLETFTTRELEVGQLVAEGLVNKEIARHLKISVKTVESHRGAAMAKANVTSAAAFVRFAIKHKLIQV